jgi:hypothetical protein
VLQIREVLVDYYTKCAWVTIFKNCDWKAIDTDSSGYITRDEVVKVAQGVYGKQVGAMVVDNLMASADLNRDNKISKEELFTVGMLGVVGFFRDSKTGKPVFDLEAYTVLVDHFFGEDVTKNPKIRELLATLAAEKKGGMFRIEVLHNIAKNLGNSITI